MKKTKVSKESQHPTAAIGRALSRAAKFVRETAPMHATPIYGWKNGKVAGENP